MIIVEHEGKFHVVKSNLVYGSFRHRVEAEAFLTDLAADNVFLGATSDERQVNIARLLTIEQVKNGEVLKPIETPKEFNYLGSQDPTPNS